MREKCNFTFYKMDKCGFYKYNSDEASAGAPIELFNDFLNWLDDNKTLQETLTYQPNLNDNLMRTFCYDVIHRNGDYFITTWNEIPNKDGQIWSLEIGKKAKDAGIDNTKLKEGYVPGYATYFWIIPSQKIYATIKIDNPLNGNQNFVKYMKSYLTFHSSFCQKFNEDENFYINGFLIDDHKHMHPVYPNFSSRLFQKEGEFEKIERNYSNIKKIITKIDIDQNNKQDLDLYQKFLKFFDINKEDDTIQNKLKFRFETNYNPNREELSTIISEWLNRDKRSDEDLGFNIKGYEGTYWLSHSLLKIEKTFDLERINGEIVSLESIANHITINREFLLKNKS